MTSCGGGMCWLGQVFSFLFFLKACGPYSLDWFQMRRVTSDDIIEAVSHCHHVVLFLCDHVGQELI